MPRISLAAFHVEICPRNCNGFPNSRYLETGARPARIFARLWYRNRATR